VQESSTVNVTINPIPAAIANNSGPVCESSSVQLFANVVAEATYRWYDGDPAGAPAGNLIALEANPVIDNLAPGNHTFHLTLEKAGCVSPSTATTAVVQTGPNVSPVANYTLTTNCAPSDLSLLANVVLGTGAIATYQWIGPNNFSSTLANPTIPDVTAAYNGTYQLSVTDINGCTAQGSVQLTSIQDALPMPILSHKGPDCAGGSISLSVPQYAAASVDYTWTTPSGTTTNISGLNTNQIVITPLLSGTHDGQYFVQIAVDGCFLSSDTFDLDVLSVPSATPAATTGVICEGAILDLNANASGATAYSWSGPNNWTSNAENPQINNVTAQTNGTYTLVVSNANNCTAVQSVIVNNISPSPNTPSITSNAPVCEDDNISLSIQQQYTGTTINYNWTNGAGTTIGNTAALSFAANAATAIAPYRVEVTVDGCTSELSLPETVEVLNLPTATASNTGAICPGDQAQLVAGTIPEALYEWRVAGNSTIISTDQNPIIYGLTSTTVYELTVIAANCIADPLSTTTITVNTPPTLSPSINYTVNADCAPATLALTAGVTLGTGAILSYQWTGPNNWTSSIANPNIPAATAAYNG
ncbi:MAG: hypothetical protein AAGD05_16500, partial [Bacteroidota bacterium]